MLGSLAFIDKISVKTNRANTTRWAPRGLRLIKHSPFGHWRIQTFIGALRHDRLDATVAGVAQRCYRLQRSCWHVLGCRAAVLNSSF
jgi:hypothetical protein